VSELNADGEPCTAEVIALRHRLRDRQSKSLWFRIGRLTFRNPVAIVSLLCAVGVPFFYFSSELKVSFDLFYQVPRNSPHAGVLRDVMENMGGGAATPYYVTVVTPEANGLRSDAAFAKINELIQRINTDCGQPLNKMVTFSMIAQAGDVTYLTYDSGLNSAVAALSMIPDYQFLWNQTVDPTARAGLIRLEPLFNPFGPASNAFLNQLHTVVTTFDTDGLFVLGFMGASADSWAIMRRVFELFPLQIGITFGVIFVFIAVVFRSVFIPFRMIFTVAFTVAAAFGIGVVIFQYDWSHSLWTGMQGVSAYSWTVPIFSFSLLCALALDYDVFLLTRLVELKTKGFTDEAAVAKAVWRTGRIISFAGLIMAISFGGLMFSGIIMLNQFGFIALFAVLLDTFVVRTFFVPSLMSIAPRVSWWPRKYPESKRGIDDMGE